MKYRTFLKKIMVEIAAGDQTSTEKRFCDVKKI